MEGVITEVCRGLDEVKKVWLTAGEDAWGGMKRAAEV